MSSIDVRSIDDKDLRKEPCPATKQEFRVFLSEEAFDRAVARGDSDTTREIGGVLVGELLRDDAGPYLLIETTIDALHAEEKGAELTFTHATWEHIHKEMDGKHENKRVVGWYHTHPGFGVFLSDRDQFIQKSFFNLPFQVAFVYDPKSHEHGMFTWHDNEVWRARRYWIGPREQAWDGPRTAGDKADKPARKVKAEGTEGSEGKPARTDAGDPRDSRDEASLSGSLGSLILIGVVLLLVGGFAGHWFGAGSANQVLAEAQRELTNAKIEGAQLQVAQLQINLVEVLRNTLGDEALRRPIGQAVDELDRALAWLPAPSAPAPAAGSPAAPGAGGAATPPGSGAARPPVGSGAGSAAVAGAGSATAPGPGSAVAPGAGTAAAPAVGGTVAPGAGTAVAPAAGGAVAPAAGGDARLQELSAQLRGARDRLLVIAQGRVSALVVLTQLESLARRGSELRADLGHDVAEQRSGLGALYAELAADAVKAKDLERARRLLATAAHLDPGNRSRYEQQLQSFDKTASLPRDITDNTGSAGQGNMR